ncbi:MAG: type II toxin-antitoxin system Phd/YefM family antitoxin [Opitutaceae bacterium]
MKTLTVTKARQNLGGWLKRAVAGEEIGVVFGDQVVALRPVPIMAADYMETEYGLTKEEAERAAERIRAETRAALASGDYLDVTGKSLDQFLAPRRARKGRSAKAIRGVA